VSKVLNVGQDAEPGGAHAAVMVVKFGQIVGSEPSLVPRAKNSSTRRGDANGTTASTKHSGHRAVGPTRSWIHSLISS
jgi:hypothetical protein